MGHDDITPTAPTSPDPLVGTLAAMLAAQRENTRELGKISRDLVVAGNDLAAVSHELTGFSNSAADSQGHRAAAERTILSELKKFGRTLELVRGECKNIAQRLTSIESRMAGGEMELDSLRDRVSDVEGKKNDSDDDSDERKKNDSDDETN